MNINGIDSRNENHTMLQICHNLHKIGVYIVGLTETYVHWNKSNVFNNFEGGGGGQQWSHPTKSPLLLSTKDKTNRA